MKNEMANEYGDIALLIFFEGRVQGVSFRFTTNTYAKAAFVSGYVENTSDFEVKALFIGQKEDINFVINKLVNEFDIRSTRAERIPIGKLDIEFTPHKILYEEERYVKTTNYVDDYYEGGDCNV